MCEPPAVNVISSTRLKPNVVIIPGHPGDDVPMSTLKAILKAAGLEGKQ